MCVCVCVLFLDGAHLLMLHQACCEEVAYDNAATLLNILNSHQLSPVRGKVCV